MRLVRVLCCALVLAGVLGAAGPAAAHDDHPGWYLPSPESATKNLKLVASAPRTKPISTYRNSDLAFWGRYAYGGHYDGFRILDISEPESPQVIVDFPCPGSQHDVSVWDGFLFVSVETPRTSPACDSTAQPGGTPGFEGIRIFDVRDPAQPVLVAGVPTDCGSHTHTLVPDTANDRVLLYVSSYTASVLPASSYGNECVRFDANVQIAHNKISVVEVPLAAPSTASVVSEPRFPQNDYRNTPGFRGCHDITVFLEMKRAAAACMGEGQIWDISDLEAPTVVGRVHNPNVEFFHSATFSWDGRTVVFGDEAGGGTGPRCRAQDPVTLGALWFYDVGSLDTLSGSEVEPPLGSFKVPRAQGDTANCTMHNFNAVPLHGRNVLVSSAYAAGTTVIDFTDPTNPVEVGHHDPHGANTWSSYWYNGFIYTSDSGRGIDVMNLTGPTTAGARKLPHLNPQTQISLLQPRGAGRR